MQNEIDLRMCQVLTCRGDLDAVVAICVAQLVEPWRLIVWHTVLYKVASTGHKAVVRLLLDKGTEVHAKDDLRGGMALH
jgi:hypothetical protein